MKDPLSTEQRSNVVPFAPCPECRLPEIPFHRCPPTCPDCWHGIGADKRPCARCGGVGLLYGK